MSSRRVYREQPASVHFSVSNHHPTLIKLQAGLTAAICAMQSSPESSLKSSRVSSGLNQTELSDEMEVVGKNAEHASLSDSEVSENNEDFKAEIKNCSAAKVSKTGSTNASPQPTRAKRFKAGRNVLIDFTCSMSWER